MSRGKHKPSAIANPAPMMSAAYSRLNLQGLCIPPQFGRGRIEAVPQ
jgi:hypothetical protein